MQKANIIKLLLLCLLSSSCTQAKVTSADTKTISAIYEGIDGYGVTDHKEKKGSFTFRFASEGALMSYSIPSDGGSYTLQNRLKEGLRYTLTPSDDGLQLLDLIEETPEAQGTVTNISADWIEIDGIRIPMSNSVNFNDIQKKPGGSVATLINMGADGDKPPHVADIQPGDHVKVYGDPARLIDRTFTPTPYKPVICGTPGKRTLKNFLQTAFMPLGTTLYVYGGAWNWQDDGPDINATTIGLPEDWISFFQMNDASYEYKNVDPSVSYYPWHGYNEYHFAGADCSGFVGWTIYNTLNTNSGEKGYVMSSGKMAKKMAESDDLGIFSKNSDTATFLPGDIISMKGHVYIVVGRCDDGSLLIIHSSVNDGKGSGVQLSALGKNDDCEALRLARQYTSEYYPEWSARYNPVLKPSSLYLDFSSGSLGRFSWYASEKGLTDPDGYREMNASQILADLFSITNSHPAK